MAKLILRQKAIDDLSDIWDYTSQTWSENQADKYYAMIKSACREISKSSTIGRKYDKVENDLLGHRIGKHIIFYQIVSNNEIEVIRILHERMDLKNKLTE
ncbi:Toxin ParE1 [Mariniflexile rhizosphaerae]|uniref:type II toxin-antitoxin system RelE/ParE family toxin n=1 Tax=unclassified Mariniflexile TaxID=2643887 RepID=UPI000CC172EF|nr:type II toxin-antitoxin system RelE/ParE family toxin [Mariniflexile sp. TRM1-10]AXP80368.1 Toxin ParE1 [Mariniflexile sp. TRM1-10]PLB20614.1 MAG: Plasmid stabilization system protein [Flavobacteriaceae bacterium FS1-H7996/R]